MTTPVTYIHEKHFSYSEALASLALVRPIAADIVAKTGRLNKLKIRLNELKMSDFCQHDEIQVLETGAKFLMREIKYHLQELEQVGCLLKDPLQGLIDFPSLYKNQEVYLCWKLGETTILEYHGVYDGTQGRKEIPFDMIS